MRPPPAARGRARSRCHSDGATTPRRPRRDPEARRSPGVPRHPLQDHQVVTVDHFVEALVPEPLLDLLRLRPPDLAQLRRIEVDDAARELLAPGAPQEGHHLTRGEVPLDLDYA